MVRWGGRLGATKVSSENEVRKRGAATGKGERTLITSHVDVGVQLQVLREQVAERVVLLVQDEVGRVGHACASR